jgi:hypothetical protein
MTKVPKLDFFFESGINSLRLTQSSPSPSSLFCVTSRGEVCVFDPAAAEKAGTAGDVQRTQVTHSLTSDIKSMTKFKYGISLPENLYSLNFTFSVSTRVSLRSSVKLKIIILFILDFFMLKIWSLEC